MAIREDGGTLGVFSPKKVQHIHTYTDGSGGVNCVKHSNASPFSHFCLFSFRGNCLLFCCSSHQCCFFFFYHSVILSTHCLLLPSQTQLRHEQLFDEQFDCFSTKEVCLIDSQRAFPALDFIEFPYVTI